jgi:hypothetical protein
MESNQFTYQNVTVVPQNFILSDETENTSKFERMPIHSAASPISEKRMIHYHENVYSMFSVRAESALQIRINLRQPYRRSVVFQAFRETSLTLIESY